MQNYVKIVKKFASCAHFDGVVIDFEDNSGIDGDDLLGFDRNNKLEIFIFIVVSLNKFNRSRLKVNIDCEFVDFDKNKIKQILGVGISSRFNGNSECDEHLIRKKRIRLYQ